jgi:hypothetical protein
MGVKEVQPADVRLTAAFHFAIYREVAKQLLWDLVMDLYAYLMEQAISWGSGPRRCRSRARSCTTTRTTSKSWPAFAHAILVAAFDRHLYRIYTTTRAILNAKRQRGSCDASAATPEG